MAPSLLAKGSGTQPPCCTSAKRSARRYTTRNISTRRWISLWTRSRAPTSAPLERPTLLPYWPPARREDCRSEEHTSELQSRLHLVCRLLLEKKKKKTKKKTTNRKNNRI